MVRIYSKPGCGKCEAAKEKLAKMGIKYEEHSLEYHITFHADWREDESVCLLAWCCERGDPAVQLPTLKIGDEFFSYSEAMKKLKLNQTQSR